MLYNECQACANFSGNPLYCALICNGEKPENKIQNFKRERTADLYVSGVNRNDAKNDFDRKNY